MTSFHQPSRRVVRRAVRTACSAVATTDFRFLGERVLDLSPYGMMLAADDGAELGAPVIVSFQAPGSDRWFDAAASVARVVEGFRPWDPGYCLGLRFTRIPLESRITIGEHLRGLPPPVPARPLRPSYAAWVERAAA